MRRSESAGRLARLARNASRVISSSLNDGLALPIVLALMALVGHEALHVGGLAWELALGVAVPSAGCRIERSRFFSVRKSYEPIFAFSLACWCSRSAS